MNDGWVQTVNGPIGSESVGLALPHEHLLIWNTSWWTEPEEISRKAFAHSSITLSNLGRVKRNPLLVRDNLIISDIDCAIEELKRFRAIGGSTLVDLTNTGLGRDPEALRKISYETGVNIVMGCGYYVAKTHPKEVREKSAEELAEIIAKDIMVGVGDTGIKAGIIGEIGTGYPVDENEKKVLRAAAMAQKITRASIVVHASQWYRTGLEILDILEEAGAFLNKVVIAHLDQKHPMKEQLEYHKSIAKRGAFCEYDVWGCEWDFEDLDQTVPPDTDRAYCVKELADSGYLARILLSHDICTKTQLCSYGGHGYAFLPTSGRKLLRREGLTEAEIDTILVDNVKRLLTIT